MKLSDTFKFGKFKGQTLKYVMANKGSYVGWCLENIPNFHIEPKDMEELFLQEYNKWKEHHIGTTIVCGRTSSDTNVSGGVLGQKMMLRRIKETIDHHNDDMLTAYCDDEDLMYPSIKEDFLDETVRRI